MTQNNKITFEVCDSEAMALAQFLKRAGYMECRACASSETEAYAIRDALNSIRNAVSDAGFSPR